MYAKCIYRGLGMAIKNCVQCGEEFWAKDYGPGRPGTLCSNCKADRKKEASRQWHQEHYAPIQRANEKCVQCGKEFEVKAKKGPSERTCSNTCRQAWRYKKRYKERTDKIRKICGKCGTSFEVSGPAKGPQKFCQNCYVPGSKERKKERDRERYARPEIRDRNKLLRQRRAALRTSQFRNCSECGSSFEVRGSQNVCSLICRQLRVRRQRRDETYKEKQRLHRSAWCANNKEKVRDRNKRYAKKLKSDPKRLLARRVAKRIWDKMRQRAYNPETKNHRRERYHSDNEYRSRVLASVAKYRPKILERYKSDPEFRRRQIAASAEWMRKRRVKKRRQQLAIERMRLYAALAEST